MTVQKLMSEPNPTTYPDHWSLPGQRLQVPRALAWMTSTQVSEHMCASRLHVLLYLETPHVHAHYIRPMNGWKILHTTWLWGNGETSKEERTTDERERGKEGRDDYI